MNTYALVGWHALVGDKLYTIVKGHAYDLPPIPDCVTPEIDSVLFKPFNIIDCAYNQFPFMMLIPKHRPFYYPLFDHLDIEEFKVPVKCLRPGRWCLDPKLVTEWVSLERNLCAAVYALLKICGGALPKLFQFWPFPKSYRYKLSYSCHCHMQIITMWSRDAFTPLIAAVMLMFLLL
jgi:hypothetical protein